MTQSWSELFTKVACLTLVSTVIVCLSAFSVYIHYDFVFHPKTPFVELNQHG